MTTAGAIQAFVAVAMYLRFTHAISYRRLSRLLAEVFGLAISGGALDAAFQRAMPCLGAEVGAILARLRRARVVCSTRPPCGSMASPTGTGCSRTARW